jgi:histidinol-phosphate aminotransferase
MKKHLKNVIRKFDTEDKSQYDFILNQSERVEELSFFDWNRFKQSLTQEDFFLYPNTSKFRKKLSNYYKVKDDNVFLCAGSDVGIKSVFETFTDGGKVVTTDPSFPMYKIYSELYQCEYFGIPHEEDYTISVEKILSNITNDTDLIILANPNSPMGEYKSIDDIIPILQQDVPVLIDEAYIEFTEKNESFIKYIDRYPNLIITRTFSKAFGAAGCRVGCVISNKNNIELISKFRQMYEISGVSMKYCEWLLDNTGLVEDYWKDIERERNFLTFRLKKIGDMIDSVNCNWVHFNTSDDNKKTQEVFSRYKVLAKFCSIPHDDKKNWCRLTITPGMCDEEWFKELLDVYR